MRPYEARGRTEAASARNVSSSRGAAVATLGTRPAAPASCRSARSSTIRSDDAPTLVTESPHPGTSATLPTRAARCPHMDLSISPSRSIAGAAADGSAASSSSSVPPRTSSTSAMSAGYKARLASVR